ncbi:unnamed protein product [Staurois parvus]|uniref:Uncharacterized protein n=1 Tax=Staurois parvus TaxID=386267 RepID=A0ABN9AY01_9NEOB|nr:unnamed protein product [Staurois parvus]
MQYFLLLSGCILAGIEKYCESCDHSQISHGTRLLLIALYHVTSVIIHRFHTQ